jgi:hypothetical protein
LLLYSSHLALGVSNWPVIYFINYTPTSSLALFITAPSVSPGAGAAKVAAWAAVGRPAAAARPCNGGAEAQLCIDIATRRPCGSGGRAWEPRRCPRVLVTWCCQGCRMGGAGQTCCNNEPMQWWHDRRRNIASASWRSDHADHETEGQRPRVLVVVLPRWLHGWSWALLQQRGHVMAARRRNLASAARWHPTRTCSRLWRPSSVYLRQRGNSSPSTHG